MMTENGGSVDDVELATKTTTTNASVQVLETTTTLNGGGVMILDNGGGEMMNNNSHNGGGGGGGVSIPPGGGGGDDELQPATTTKKRGGGSAARRRGRGGGQQGGGSNSGSSHTNSTSHGSSGKSSSSNSSTTSSTATAKFIKYAALFLLVAQMVGLVLLMRYSRTQKPTEPGTPLYLASTAVFIMEIMKLVICFMVIAYQSGSIIAFMNEIYIHIMKSPHEILKLCVPSLLYTIQNNLLYLALTNLDAATYQVCYQLKILTTALFSAMLLGRTFSKTKWLSLIILTIGVAIVQISGSGDQHTTTTTTTAHQHDADQTPHLLHHHNDEAQDNSGDGGTLEQDRQLQEPGTVAHDNNDDEEEEANKNRFIGLVAVLCAACTSGFSGVYFERILKKSQTSLWIRNVQMGLPSVIIAYITIYIHSDDATMIQKYGFFVGYTNIVWLVVTVQAVGGLIVATVVKYADNVLKVFATSFSIIISCIISAFLFDFQPTITFLVGASLVITATVMYSSPERKSYHNSRNASSRVSSRRQKTSSAAAAAVVAAATTATTTSSSAATSSTSKTTITTTSSQG